MRLITHIGLILLCAFGCSPTKKQDTPPNVLFILVDDLGARDLGFSGSDYYETPNIDSLASKSFIFTNGYAASRVCSPSRASIMTGKFTGRHGITDWIGARSGEEWRKQKRYDKLLPAAYEHALATDEITLAEAFKQNGYRTFFSGKWHIGKEGSYPEDHGFDINKGGWEVGSPIGGFFSPWENPSLPNNFDGENLSMRLAKETSQFIKQYKDSTFLAFLSFYAVHAPIQTTKPKWEKYRSKAVQMGIRDSGYTMERVLPIRKVQDNPVYAGLVETVDDAVGLVLNTLDSLDLMKNTIVVFTSDNGGVASGDNYSTSNLPLRGGKGYQWEGGIREPFLIYVPWLEDQAGQIEEPVINTDLYPTLLDLAGFPLKPEQHIDGISLKPLLEGGSIAERPLFWHYPHYGNQGGEPSSVIRFGNWKLIHYWEDDRNELYDLSSDPSEQNDIVGLHPEISSDLYQKLDSFLISVNARYPEPDPQYDPDSARIRNEYIRNELKSRLEQRRLEFLMEDFQPNEDWWGTQAND